MTWTKLPDDWDQVEPYVSLSDNAIRLHIDGLRYCNRHLTDGFISAGAVRTVAPTFKQKGLRALVERGLWRAVDGGFRLTDFALNQPSRADVERLRADKSRAGQEGGRRSGEARRLKQERSIGEAPHQAADEARASSPAETEANPVPEPAPEPDEVRTEVRRGRAALSNKYGKDAQQAVIAYCKARREAGLEVARSECGKLARHFMTMRSEGWDQEIALAAVRAYAATQRSPLYFREWVFQTFHRQGEEEHARRKAEPPMAREAFFALLDRAAEVARR